MKEILRLKNLVIIKKKGAKPSFSYIELIRSIRIIGIKRLISRNNLAKELEIGEGTVRTLIKRLKEENMINIIKSGIYLSKKGKEIYEILDKTIKKETFLSKKKLKDFALDEYNYCLVLRNLTNKVKTGIEERDEALKFGVKGLITIINKKGKLMFPDGFIIEEKYKEICNYIKNVSKLKENGLILISSSKNKIASINAAYGVLFYLIVK